MGHTTLDIMVDTVLFTLPNKMAAERAFDIVMEMHSDDQEGTSVQGHCVITIIHTNYEHTRCL